jgi:hypothetical protein
MTLAGLPHSEIPGSKPVCGSPRLIAAYHVLLRLSAPRHPPCTLSSLTNLDQLFTRRILSLLTRFNCQRTRLALESAVSSNPKARGHRAFQRIDVTIVDSLCLTKNPATPVDPLAWRQAGGADRVRTDDLRLARAALSQLSYSPDWFGQSRPDDWWA